jgi:uncharacterized membrane protein
MQNPPPGSPYGATYNAPDAAGKSSTGLDANIAALLAYLLGWVSGLVFYLIEKENRYVRFHAMQSILLGAAAIVIMIVFRVLAVIPFIGFITGLLSLVVWLGYIAIWIYCMVMAFQRRDFRLPVIGDMAANIVNK